MFAIQPPSLPSAAQMLLAIDPAAEPAPQNTFDAQFSALLASAVTAASQPAAANAPARSMLPAARDGKDEAAGGKLPGKQDGNILPDLLAALAAPQNEVDAAPLMPEASNEAALAGVTAAIELAPATVTLQEVLAQISVPTPVAVPAPSNVSAHAARPARLLAMASTAPATATSAMPRALANGAALPPQASDPATAGQSASAAAPSQEAAAVPSAPAIRIPLALALPTALTLRQPQGEIEVAIVVSEAPAPPAQMVTQPVAQAQAASLALVQQTGKSGEPDAPPSSLAPLELPSAQLGAELAKTALETAAAAPQTLAAPASAPVTAATPSAIQPHDFAALVDRLVEARQAVQASLTSQTVQASVQHPEFGRVSLSFQQDPAGMTVSFANPDPDLARAVQNLVPAALSTDIRSADAGTAAQRQDGQAGSGAASSGQSQGQPQGQPQGQLSAQQQRGQSSQREAAFGTAAQGSPAAGDAEAPASSRGGIFA